MTDQSVTGSWRYAALTAAILAALSIVACSKKAPPAPADAPATSKTAVAPATAAVSTDAELMAKAKSAESDKRLYAPAGDNAIEYYLALRQRNPKDEIVKNALQDLFPYAMIATEQSLKKGDEAGRVEAARIFALLERVDTNAPSLPRLRAMMQQEAATELKQQQDQAKKAQDTLAKQTELAKQAEAAKATAAIAAQQRPQPQPTFVPTQPPPKQAVQQPQRQAQVEAPAPEPVQPPPPPPKPARAAGTFPEVVSSVQPAYPRDALRDQVAGEVVVAFTVNPDGSVGDASVVSSNPRRVFDRAALDAIRKWRFEAPGTPVSGRRTFAFNPGG
ncbi:MAG: energy transducer TonB [Lysobacteraceae bacterium]